MDGRPCQQSRNMSAGDCCEGQQGVTEGRVFFPE